MSRNRSKSRSKKKGPTEKILKGRLVETIVALLHDLPNVKVERNVKLKPVQGSQDRTREIDVLVTSEVTGYPVRIAFSCKNEREKVGVGIIGEFIDQLNDVGIPVQHGIVVCVNGYTRDALDRARSVGIRPLILEGLTKSRLASEVAKAFQFQVNLLCEVRSVTITNTASTQEYEGQFFLFFDDHDHACGNVADLILTWWQNCDARVLLGERELDLEVPADWKQYVDGTPQTPLQIRAIVHIRGLIVTLAGEEKRHALINASSRQLEREQIQVDFEGIPKNRPLPITVVNNEAEFHSFTEQQGSTRLILKIKLPRLLYHSFYYPFSERVGRLINERFQQFEAGQIADPRQFSLEETEGSDLKAMWEAPWYADYQGDAPPVIVTDETGTLVDVRLLMKQQAYTKIVALDPVFQENPTREFAHYLYWSNIALGNEIATKALSGKPPAAARLLNAAKDRFTRASQILPNEPDAHLQLATILHRLEEYSLALEAYEKALSADQSSFLAWTGRASTLLKMERFDDALVAINKAISFAKDTESQVYALRMRSYVHLRTGRHDTASEDLINAWKLDPALLLSDSEHDGLIEAICVRSTSAEALLLLTELYWRQATETAATINFGRARAGAALVTLRKLKPLDEMDDTQHPASINGGLVYDCLTRSAHRLLAGNDKEMALDNISAMQDWALQIFGEPFDSLTACLAELAR